MWLCRVWGFASLCLRPLRLQPWTRTAERTRPPSSARPPRLRRRAPSGWRTHCQPPRTTTPEGKGRRELDCLSVSDADSYSALQNVSLTFSSVFISCACVFLFVFFPLWMIMRWFTAHTESFQFCLRFAVNNVFFLALVEMIWTLFRI